MLANRSIWFHREWTRDERMKNWIFVSRLPDRIRVISVKAGHIKVVHFPPQKMISACSHPCAPS